MRRPRETATTMIVAGLIALPAPAMSAAGWPSCWRDDGCPSLYLNVFTSQGDATLSVDRSCAASWRHVWGQRDARQTIVQWLDADAARCAFPSIPTRTKSASFRQAVIVVNRPRRRSHPPANPVVMFCYGDHTAVWPR